MSTIEPNERVGEELAIAAERVLTSRGLDPRRCTASEYAAALAEAQAAADVAVASDEEVERVAAGLFAARRFKKAGYTIESARVDARQLLEERDNYYGPLSAAMAKFSANGRGRDYAGERDWRPDEGQVELHLHALK